MAMVRLIITLKPGVLDAQGQAVGQGLRALGYDAVSSVKVGRYLELTLSDDADAMAVQEMCERFLANPLIEEWRMEGTIPGEPLDQQTARRPWSGAH